jgi:hypothetical protein
LVFFWCKWPVITHGPVVDKAVSEAERHIGGNSEEERVDRKDFVSQAFQSVVNGVLSKWKRWFARIVGGT